MRNLAVFGARDGPTGRSGGLPEITIDETTMRCAIVRTADTRFDASAAENRRRVCVKVLAMSCNYRDRGLMFRMRAFGAQRFVAVGSEFVGEVIAVGPDVRHLKEGDRVVPDHHYTGGGVSPDGVRQGVPTNAASKELLILPEQKLCRIPDSMPNHIAAALTLNGQTAFSMVRKAAVRPGSRVLVMAATSNTALATISALTGAGVCVVASTTSHHFADALRAMGASDVLLSDRGGPAAGEIAADPLREWVARHGEFDAIIDPFFDLHLQRVVGLLAPFGRYITCGLAGQNPSLAAAAGVTGGPPMTEILFTVLVRNLQLLGNCLGVTEDLERALAAYETRSFTPVIDSVYSGERAAAFLNRTFNDRNRFGKVVFSYID